MKTLAKPVSKRIKVEFSRYEVTQRLLVRVGQLNHNITSRMSMWSAGYTVREIKPLSVEKAVKEGSEFVGEFFVLGVSIGTLLFEYNRSLNKEAEKAEKKRAEAAAERKDLQRKLHALDLRLQALEEVVQANSQSIFSVLQGSTEFKPPPKAKLVQIVDDDVDLSEDEEEKPTDKSTSTSTTHVEKTRSIDSSKRWWWP